MKELKCDMVQGFLHSKAMPAEDISALIVRERELKDGRRKSSRTTDVVDNLIAFRKDKK